MKLQEVKNVDRNYIENNKSKYSKREYSFGRKTGLEHFQNVFLAAEDIIRFTNHNELTA